MYLDYRHSGKINAKKVLCLSSDDDNEDEDKGSTCNFFQIIFIFVLISLLKVLLFKKIFWIFKPVRIMH